jgi:hypothetical protein
MFIFISIVEANSVPNFHVSFDRGLGDVVAEATFPATKDGAYALGKHIASVCPGADEFACSSDIDFADEYGVNMTSDDICNAIMLGMGCAISAF